MRAPEWLLRIRDEANWRWVSIVGLRAYVAEALKASERRFYRLEEQTRELARGDGTARLQSLAIGNLDARLIALEGTVANARDGRRIEALEYSIGSQAEALKASERRFYRLEEQIGDLGDDLRRTRNELAGQIADVEGLA